MEILLSNYVCMVEYTYWWDSFSPIYEIVMHQFAEKRVVLLYPFCLGMHQLNVNNIIDILNNATISR